MKTLNVRLKQHTPMIHFQHDQDCATLRASEVKPKLDKYIVEHGFKNDYRSCKKYLVGYKFSNKKVSEDREKEEEILNKGLEKKFEEMNYRALNYKLRIHATEIDKEISLNDFSKRKSNYEIKKSQTVYETEMFPLILSNMGGKEDREDLANFSFSEYVEIDFTFWDRDRNFNVDGLSKAINEHIVCFFANTNFGQRSNKGFGSFTVDKKDGVKVSWNHNEVYEDDTQMMRYGVDDEGFDKMRKLFAVIDFYWKCLKSGVNCTKRTVISSRKVKRTNTDRYIKPYLWTYLNNCGLTWEKRMIKTGLSLESVSAINDGVIVSNSKPAFFARAHLGCPIKGIMYRVALGTLIREREELKEEVTSIDISIFNSRTHEIERIASPIIFKPVFCTIKENNIVKNVGYIYVLYDKQILEALRTAADVDFTFTRSGFTGVKLPLFLRDAQENRILLDYHKLIKQFHNSLGFKMMPRDFRWNYILGKNEVQFRRVVKNK